MKIIQLIYSLCSGGAERFVVSLSNQLTEMGHDVTVCMLLSDQNDSYVFNRQFLDSRVKFHSMGYLPGFSLKKVIDVEKYIEEHYKKELNIVRSYGYQENASLSSSFEFRLNALRAYDADYIAEIDKALEAEINLQQDAAEKERDNLLKQNDEEYRIQYNALGERLVETENALKAIEKVTTDAGKQMTKEEKELFDIDNLYKAFSSGKKGCEPYRDILGGNYLRPAKLTALVLNVMANSNDPKKYENYAKECINHSDIRVRTAAQRLLGKTE